MFRKDFIEGSRGLHYEDEEEYMKMHKVMLPYKKTGAWWHPFAGKCAGA